MASNVYTKNEILQQLASRGYFIDAYTLDTFFKKWKIESIFEDEQGTEFYDKDVLETVLDNLFNAKDEKEDTTQEEEIRELKTKSNKEEFDNLNININQPQIQTQPQIQQQQIQIQPQVQIQPLQQQYGYSQQFAYPQQQQIQIQPQTQFLPQQNQNNQQTTISDKQTADMLKNISLSDGTPLMNNIDGLSNIFNNVPQGGVYQGNQHISTNNLPSMFDNSSSISLSETSMFDDSSSQTTEIDIITGKPKIVKKMGILEGAMELAKQDDEKIEAELASLGFFHEDFVTKPNEEKKQETATEVDDNQFQAFQQKNEEKTQQFQEGFPSNVLNQTETEVTPVADLISKDENDFDDMNLLSESLEAQEKFKDYIISELKKKNADFNPATIQQSNEFKLDISERTITMIARTMAKKIAKNLNNIFSADAKSSTELNTVKEEYKKLEEKNKELEEQNKKLKLLLTENKRYLSSFQPSIFGLYKKVDPSKIKGKNSKKE